MPQISAGHIYQYLKCPSWLWLDAFENREKRTRIQPLGELLMRQGLLEAHHLLRNRDFVYVAEDDLDAASQKTLSLMRQGAPVIYKGVLLHGSWVARPDVLERVEGRSVWGDYYYIACDLKSARQLEDVHRFQGVFYALLLEKLQNARPVHGYVMHADGTVSSFLIEQNLPHTHAILEDIERILQGERPAPFLKPSCAETPWHHVCREQAEACDDLSLIAGLTPREHASLREAGYQTVADLEEVSMQEIMQRIPSITGSRIERLITQAKVLRSGAPQLRMPAALPKTTREIFFTMVIDPSQSLVCAIGILVRESGRDRLITFFADRPTDEARIWQDAARVLTTYHDASIFHFGMQDVKELRRLAERYGHVLSVFEYAIDVQTVTHRSAVFPVYHYTLAELAGTLGFIRSHGVMNTVDRVASYHRFLQTENRAARESIISAMEDDLRSIALLKDWLAHATVGD
ncbi:MAG: TM0106 family RecB-like putative nuclease [bacterium]|nr:TM0106 family RecB-like putative nuclease [bacterium]